MFFEEASKIVQFISAFILILIAIIILSQKRGKWMPRFFLSTFLISRSFIILGFISYYYYDLLYSYPDLYVIGEPFLFLYAPFLFLYTRASTSSKPAFRIYDIFHFVPFVAVAGYFLLYFHFSTHDLKVMMLLNDELFDHFLIDGTMLWIQFAVYATACIYLLIIYKIRIEQFNSSYRQDLFRWLVFLVGAFILWKGIFVSGYLFGVFEGEYSYLFKIIVELGFLFYASMIAYKGLQLPHVVLSLSDGISYKHSKLTADDRQTMILKLQKVMQDDKEWRNPDLNLSELAQLTTIPVNQLSQILNTEIKQNFYNYVNSFRIEAAKKMLADPEQSDKTVLEILYEVGFNSKSVFNTAFKKHTGSTPTKYRNDSLKETAA